MSAITTPDKEVRRRAVRWITGRANELLREGIGMSAREALRKACNESGFPITEEEQNAIMREHERQHEQPKLEIVTVSESEFKREIERARARGDLMIEAKKR